MSEHPIHQFKQIARFEDVDAMGVVYHPNYLSYLERARSQRLIDAGHSFKSMMDEGLGIVIVSIEMKYVRPLCLEESFLVLSQVDRFKGSQIFMTQAIVSPDQEVPAGCLKENLRKLPSLYFFAHLRMCAVSTNNKRPVALPDWIKRVL